MRIVRVRNKNFGNLVGPAQAEVPTLQPEIT